MSIDFFVDLAVTGTVLGLDDTSDDAAVRAVFGSGFEPGDEIQAYSYGLVEFGWYELRGTCEVAYFGAQPHRLPWLNRDGGVEPELVERYGEFPDRVDVDELRAATARRGFPLVEVPHHDEDHVDYWSPVSRMSALVERGSRSVVKLLGRVNAGPWLSFPGQQRAFDAAVTHLLGLDAPGREAWFDGRRTSHDGADWWRCLAMCASPKPGFTEDAVWGRRRRLELAVLRAAGARDALPPGELAVSEVGVLVEAAREGDPLGEVDDPVRRWLTAPPVPRAEAARQDVALTRLIRDQVHGLGAALPRLADPDLADELRAWVAVKPLLLGGPRAIG